jgi:hypothetical protein
MENIIHYSDILAIPFFIVLIVYIASKPKKTMMEYIILCFGIVGFCCDVLFSVYFLFYKKPECNI